MYFSDNITGIGPDSSVGKLIIETLIIEMAEQAVLKTKFHAAGYPI